MSFATLLIPALLLDSLVGEPRWIWSRVPHPAVLMGKFIAGMDHRFNSGNHRVRAGMLCASVMVLCGVAAGALLSLAGPVIEVTVAAILLAQRSLVEHVAAVSKGLRQSNEAGRLAVSMIVSRDTSTMTETNVVRSAIESAAENLSDGVIAPAFWFLVAGLPGLLTYKLINTADSMIGYRTPRHEEFGRAAARLDDLMNLIPARLTALLIALTGGVRDIAGVRADAMLHKSPNAGWPEAAMSRAVGVALAGPRSYDGVVQEFPWVNETGRRDLSAVEIDATIGMLWRAWALFLCLCLAAAVLF